MTMRSTLLSLALGAALCGEFVGDLLFLGAATAARRAVLFYLLHLLVLLLQWWWRLKNKYNF